MSTLSMDFNYERMENEARCHVMSNMSKLIALIIRVLYGLRLGKYYAEKFLCEEERIILNNIKCHINITQHILFTIP